MYWAFCRSTGTSAFVGTCSPVVKATNRLNYTQQHWDPVEVNIELPLQHRLFLFFTHQRLNSYTQHLYLLDLCPLHPNNAVRLRTLPPAPRLSPFSITNHFISIFYHKLSVCDAICSLPSWALSMAPPQLPFPFSTTPYCSLKRILLLTTVHLLPSCSALNSLSTPSTSSTVLTSYHPRYLQQYSQWTIKNCSR